MLLALNDESILVSNWFTSRVVQYRLQDGAEMASIEVGAHPTEIGLAATVGQEWLSQAVRGSPPRQDTATMLLGESY